MKLIEYFWKTSHQIVMLTPDKPLDESDIEGWGSGFLLKYKERLFLVTCDHNLHMLDDYGNGERTGKDFGIAIVCNYSNPQDRLSTGLISVPGFYYFDKIDINMPEIADLQDVAFAEIKKPFPLPILTNMLCDLDGTVVVPCGEAKLFISEEAIADADINKEYVVTGCVHNNISNGIKMDRDTFFCEGIKFTGQIHWGAYQVFQTPFIINENDWHGLSGSPVFDQDGCLVGMINEVCDGDYKIYVTPIKAIIRLMDFVIAHEDTIGHKTTTANEE